MTALFYAENALGDGVPSLVGLGRDFDRNDRGAALTPATTMESAGSHPEAVTEIIRNVEGAGGMSSHRSVIRQDASRVRTSSKLYGATASLLIPIHRLATLHKPVRSFARFIRAGQGSCRDS